MRPNIRVEIQNNLVEAMEVDENEEGEISDSEDKGTPEKPLQFTNPTVNKPPESTFQTGINILDKGKLEERARRFQLNPSEIKNFTDEDLKVLHSSLGINQSNESNTRSEVIHIRGIDQMNAGDILDYFLEYAPVSVEWIDEESCNVVWSDKISAARALHFMSKAVRGMPVRDDTSYFDNLQETEEIDQSVLVMNKNREIQLQEDGESTINKLLNETNSVDISEITSTIPPGYWRLGKKHPNAKCLLMRFSLKTDKKHFKTEQFSRYYKTQGKKNWNTGINPNAKQTTQGIFGRNKDMHRGTGNPWSILAKNWDEDAKFREKERTLKDEEPKIEVKNPTLRTRLGSKRKEEEMDTEENVKPKKMKIPRMRMYADEEEEKIKRRKMLKRINHQIKRIDDEKTSSSDLRTVLNLTSRTHAVKIEQPEPEVFDLGSTLKNRNRKMVFEIKTEEERSHRHKEISKSSKERRFSKEKRSRRYSNSDDEYSNFRHDKPQSKVAVVIKTQKRPTVASAVASTVWSRVQRPNYSESDSPSSESESSSGSASESEDGEESEEEETVSQRPTSRPGFTSQIKERPDFKSPLKIEISNDHFKRS